MTFFWCKVGFKKCFRASSLSSHWGGCHWLLYAIHFLLHVTIQSRNGLLLIRRIREDQPFKKMIFKISAQFTRHPFINFFQMQKDHRVVDVEFFGNFSCSFKRISLNDGFQLLLSTSDGQPLCSSSSKLSCLLQNFLNYNWTVWSITVPGPSALLMLHVVSTALQSILKLK